MLCFYVTDTLVCDLFFYVMLRISLLCNVKVISIWVMYIAKQNFSFWWNMILTSQNERRKGLLILKFLEVSVYNQMAQRSSGIAKGQPAWGTQAKRAKRSKGEKHASFPLLYWMSVTHSWVGAALLPPIVALANEPPLGLHSKLLTLPSQRQTTWGPRPLKLGWKPY